MFIYNYKLSDTPVVHQKCKVELFYDIIVDGSGRK